MMEMERGAFPESRSMPWKPTGAGVCLAAGGQDEAGAQGFSPGPPSSPQGSSRPDSGPASSPADGLPPPYPHPQKANQLRMAANEGSQTAGPSLLQQQINTSIKSQPSQT